MFLSGRRLSSVLHTARKRITRLYCTLKGLAMQMLQQGGCFDEE